MFCTLSENLERIVSLFSLKYIQSDFTDVNSGIAGGGIQCRMLFMEFRRRRELSQSLEIASVKCFDLAFIIILMQI